MLALSEVATDKSRSNHYFSSGFPFRLRNSAKVFQHTIR
uniref:Uncharacterized protein n=1 Tax=Arundo donax TaxID=35708 RepID=A0A0A9A7I6_ARUDO